jgi:hypothetical protein
MKYYRTLISIIILAMLAAPIPGIIRVVQAFEEPPAPDVNTPLDPNKEAKIHDVVILPAGEAFQKLQGVDFIADSELLDRAIFEKFKDNRKEALDLVTGLLGNHAFAMAGAQIVDSTRSFYVARKILQVFPSESWQSLMARYKNTDPVMKGNIVLLSGKIAAGPAVTKFLMDALSDKNVYGERNALTEGEPMRICDLAYNQLVLRFNVPSVLRCIGTVHAIEDRDSHIDTLKWMLKG